MAYEIVTNDIVTTFNLLSYDTLYQYYAGGLKKVNEFTGEEIIYEGTLVPDISIESNIENINDYMNASIFNGHCPDSVIINMYNYSMNYDTYVKIYLKYNNLYSNNYIYLIFQLLADIVLYDKNKKNFVFIKADILNDIDYPINRYTPIGIVVIPVKYNVYNNNKAGVMSLKCMSYFSPDTGTVYGDNIYIGKNLINDNKNAIPIINNVIDQSIIKGSNACYIPTDYKNNYSILCLHDENAYYYLNDADYFSASPYLTNGNSNPTYNVSTFYTTNTGNGFTYNNVLSHLNGKENTLYMINKATALPNWKTDTSLINNYTDGYSSAACCCWRYYTDGTKQGDWYLPSIGELGYFAARSLIITNSLTKIIEVYGILYASSYMTYYFGSLSSFSNGYFNINYYGYISTNSINGGSNIIRAYILI